MGEVTTVVCPSCGSRAHIVFDYATAWYRCFPCGGQWTAELEHSLAATRVPTTQHECTCDIQMLMQQGCRCGGK